MLTAAVENLAADPLSPTVKVEVQVTAIVTRTDTPRIIAPAGFWIVVVLVADAAIVNSSVSAVIAIDCPLSPLSEKFPDESKNARRVVAALT